MTAKKVKNRVRPRTTNADIKSSIDLLSGLIRRDERYRFCARCDGDEESFTERLDETKVYLTQLVERSDRIISNADRLINARSSISANVRKWQAPDWVKYGDFTTLINALADDIENGKV